MRGHLIRLWAFRELLWNIAISELKAKHRHTVLGMLWALVQPVAMALVFTLVFSVFVKVPVEGGGYIFFSYIGLVCWLFFANTMSAGTGSVVAYMNLVTKASFPREVIPLAKIISGGVDFVVAWAFLLLLILIADFPIGTAWFTIPGVMVIHVLFTAGMILWGASLYVLKRDIGSLLPLVLQGWMYLSPVVYPVNVIPEQYRLLYLANPMALIIEAYRSVVLVDTVPAVSLILPALVISCLVFVSGYLYFKSVEIRFADVM